MSDALTASVRVQIYGRVQGVWFRAWTVREAEARRLTGWVRNRADGSVEAVFAGDAAAVGTMIEACREGPPAARVERIEEWSEPWPDLNGFTQRPTR
jgi:acylphosphatase